MTSNRFDVCVDWADETLQVGTLYAHDRSAAVGWRGAEALEEHAPTRRLHVVGGPCVV